jgi:hypothetical protein
MNVTQLDIAPQPLQLIISIVHVLFKHFQYKDVDDNARKGHGIRFSDLMMDNDDLGICKNLAKPGDVPVPHNGNFSLLLKFECESPLF